MTTVNIALGRPTFYSAIGSRSKAESLLDGNLETCASIESFYNELVWLRVALDDSYYITNVVMYFQADNLTGWFENAF